MTEEQTPQEYLDNLHDVNSTWRMYLGDATVRAAIQGDMEEEELIDELNEINEGDDEVPTITSSDLWAFIERRVESLTREWELNEQRGEFNDTDLHFISRALEGADADCLMDYMSDRFPKLHAAMARYLQDEEA